jgi:hypothetical protein
MTIHRLSTQNSQSMTTKQNTISIQSKTPMNLLTLACGLNQNHEDRCQINKRVLLAPYASLGKVNIGEAELDLQGVQKTRLLDFFTQFNLQENNMGC